MGSINNAKLTRHTVRRPLFGMGLFDKNTLVKTLKDEGTMAGGY